MRREGGNKESGFMMREPKHNRRESEGRRMKMRKQEGKDLIFGFYFHQR